MENIITNGKFNLNQIWQGNDIAILKLQKPVTLSDKVAVICLPNSTDPIDLIGKKVTAIGW